MKSFAVRSLLEKGLSTILMVVLSLSMSGCLTAGSGEEADTDVVFDPSGEPLPPLTTPDRTVCDPFNVGQTARDRGLVGNLLFLEDHQPRYTRTSDYIANGTPIASTLYFDKLFVPTRAFNLGFYTQDGRVVVNQHDQPVYEYFGLRLETLLMLAEHEQPGWYQFAMLSDDGGMLSQINSDGTTTVIVNNDGNHPTRMGCAAKAVYMDRSTKLAALIEYYQGPRYHISLAVMWRRLDAAADPNSPPVEVECGRSGNSRYFNSAVVPSAPTVTYYNLLTRGWKPLENENYYFPEQANNPCAQEAPLLITGFALNSVTRTAVTVSWTTSIAATSRLEVKNVTTGQVLSTVETTGLNTSHLVTLTGLSANTLYSVKAVSVSSSGQTSTSSESAFRTPR